LQSWILTYRNQSITTALSSTLTITLGPTTGKERTQLFNEGQHLLNVLKVWLLIKCDLRHILEIPPRKHQKITIGNNECTLFYQQNDKYKPSTVEVKCLVQEYTQCPQPGLKPGLLNSERSAPTTRPLRFPHNNKTL